MVAVTVTMRECYLPLLSTEVTGLETETDPSSLHLVVTKESIPSFLVGYQHSYLLLLAV